jgi:hypothetical protein
LKTQAPEPGAVFYPTFVHELEADPPEWAMARVREMTAGMADEELAYDWRLKRAREIIDSFVLTEIDKPETQPQQRRGFKP